MCGIADRESVSNISPYHSSKCTWENLGNWTKVSVALNWSTSQRCQVWTFPFHHPSAFMVLPFHSMRRRVSEGGCKGPDTSSVTFLTFFFCYDPLRGYARWNRHSEDENALLAALNSVLLVCTPSSSLCLGIPVVLDTVALGWSLWSWCSILFSTK